MFSTLTIVCTIAECVCLYFQQLHGAHSVKTFLLVLMVFYLVSFMLQWKPTACVEVLLGFPHSTTDDYLVCFIWLIHWPGMLRNCVLWKTSLELETWEQNIEKCWIPSYVENFVQRQLCIWMSFLALVF